MCCPTESPTIACLKIEGKVPLAKELFIINKILGPTVPITYLKNVVGIKSRLHVADFM